MSIARFAAVPIAILLVTCAPENARTASPQPSGALPPRPLPAITPLSGEDLPLSTPIPGGERMKPPPGFISFCIREPSQCAVERVAPPIHLDWPTWRLLESVDTEVNDNTRPLDDKDNHGVYELWGIVRNGYGDCDDMAVTKRAKLHQSGLPLRDLRLALVLTPTNDRHLVLTVTTDRGDMVLDSLSPQVLPWRQTPYRWVMRQNGEAMGWVAIRSDNGWQHLTRACPLYATGAG